MRPDWFPDWTGEIAAIVAGGESVQAADVEALRGRCRVAVVNNAYQLAPWADLLYAADRRWWECHPQAANIGGLKVTPDKDAAKHHRLHRIDLLDQNNPQKDEITLREPGVIGRGGNSGFQVTNLVLQFGVRRILWLGFDCRGGHWHDNHAIPLRNPTPQRLMVWAETFDRQAKILARIGAEIVNCSETSAISAYPRMSVQDALAAWCHDSRREKVA